MSREIDYDKPLSDEDKRWLHNMSLDYRIEQNERRFAQSDVHAAGLPVDVTIPPEPDDGVIIESSDAAVDFDKLQDEVAALSDDELKNELEELGLSTKGAVGTLRKRLLEALKD